MGAFPGPKVHRVSRRKLGKGQHVQVPPVNITATVSTVTVSLVFGQPVVINGPIVATSTAGTLQSQAVIDTTHVNLVFSTSQAAATVTIPAGQPTIRTSQGGTNAQLVAVF